MTSPGKFGLSPDELTTEARRLLVAGWTMDEVAEKLEIPRGQVRVIWSQMFTEEIR